MQYSIVQKKELDKIVLRFDAEYYHPDFINLQNRINNLKTETIRALGSKLDCSAFYPSIVPYYDFEGTGIPFLRVNEIQNGLLNISENTAFLPESILTQNKNTIAKGYFGDLIIAKGGNTLAKVALLTNEYKEYSICRDLIILRTNNLKKVNKFFLWMFLHSSIGQNLLLRTASQTGQPHLTIEAINEICVPLFSENFQKLFELLYNKSTEFDKNSLLLFEDSKTHLLSELKLNSWKPQHKLSFIQSLSLIQNSERLDAEYFQPKYDEIVAAIEKYSYGYDFLLNTVKLRESNFIPKDKVSYKYIELSNIGASGEIVGYTENFGSELPSRARRKVKLNDLIVSSIEGSLDKIALVSKEYNNALCSTGFHVLHSGTINSETLLVYLKSIAGNLQLKKGCSGTILTAINKEELQRILIPKFDKNIQEYIKPKVIKSLDYRQQSKSILEIARNAVEIAIEKDETTALNWIKEQCRSYGVKI